MERERARQDMRVNALAATTYASRGINPDSARQYAADAAHAARQLRPDLREEPEVEALGAPWDGAR